MVREAFLECWEQRVMVFHHDDYDDYQVLSSVGFVWCDEERE